jgi:hypothetical protein
VKTLASLSAIAMLALSLGAACGKSDDAAAPADKGATPAAKPTAPAGDKAPAKPAAPAPAATADKKLDQVGVVITAPSDVNVDQQKMDMGGVQATLGGNTVSNFFVSNVNDMSDSYDATQKHAAVGGAVKEWKLQDKGADGTWKLEWTFDDQLDPGKVKYGVSFRVKAGDKLIDCGSNGLSAEHADIVIKACTSIKPL